MGEQLKPSPNEVWIWTNPDGVTHMSIELGEAVPGAERYTPISTPAVKMAMEAMRGIRDEPFGCDVCTDSSAENCRFCSYTLAWEALEDALAALKAEYGEEAGDESRCR